MLCIYYEEFNTLLPVCTWVEAIKTLEAQSFQREFWDKIFDKKVSK